MMSGLQGTAGPYYSHPSHSTHVRSLYDCVQMCLSRPSLAEKCRELTRVLVNGPGMAHHQSTGLWNAPLKDVHAAFNLLMSDVFGYPAGGTANGWNICAITLSKQGNNRDFYAALQFLSGSGPMMAMVERLMAGISGTAAGNDPSHFLFNEYPATQLPVARQSNVFLSPFEFYFYHFANAPVRRHQLFNSGGGLAHGSPAGDGGSVSDMLYPLLVEDYLNTYLPLDKGQMIKMFTQANVSVPVSQPSPQMSPGSPASSSSSSTRVKATLFRSDFASRLDCNGDHHSSPVLQQQQQQSQVRPINTAVCSVETWRSQILVRILVMFWMESYAYDYHQGGGAGDVDYLRSTASLPPPELLRVIRMFIKHSHYFTNACKSSNDVVVPMSFNADVFADANAVGEAGALRRTLLAFTHRAVDHWPLDGSFRLVLETWLSYIQPWRYMNPNNSRRQFISDNLMFYSGVLVKVLNRFFRVELATSKNAYMLYRVARVLCQENLLNIIKNAALMQPKGSPQTRKLLFDGSQVTDDIFSQDFRSLLANLLCSAVEAKHAKLNECKINESRNRAREEERGAKSKDFLSQVVSYVVSAFKGCDGNASQLSTDNAEIEKALGHLDFVVDKMGPLFGVGDVVAATARKLAATAKSTDEADSPPPRQSLDDSGETLSPSQRRDILMKRVRVESRWYDGNPDTMPVRSDESPFLVKLSLFVSNIINSRYQDEIEDIYFRRTGLLSEMFRQICTPPIVCRKGVVPEVSRVSSFSEDSDYEVTSPLPANKRQRKVRLPPRIVLRPLASYRLLFYLSVFYLAAVLFFGKSFTSATFYIGLFFTFVVAFKAFIAPTEIQEVDLTLHSLNLKLEGH